MNQRAMGYSLILCARGTQTLGWAGVADMVPWWMVPWLVMHCSKRPRRVQLAGQGQVRRWTRRIQDDEGQFECGPAGILIAEETISALMKEGGWAQQSFCRGCDDGSRLAPVFGQALPQTKLRPRPSASPAKHAAPLPLHIASRSHR